MACNHRHIHQIVARVITGLCSAEVLTISLYILGLLVCINIGRCMKHVLYTPTPPYLHASIRQNREGDIFMRS